ncbi:MAG: lysylphosphatidylglycerol synthase domain-containing protein [Endomicrobium sp.]|jgi:phosphatidylglycerol lysyltransferase|nr:lysylphosphatidylglycerol synthase domain-containing protein [Endomicrobium sp.]
MAFQTKKVLKKIISWSGLFFFCLAVYVLYIQLSKYSLDDITNAISSIPNQNLVYACIASFIGYVSLSSYDFLALHYIKRKVAAWKWIFAGFIGFSVSNNAGHAIVSGGAIRYRLYTRWRFRGSEIVRMVIFSGFTYLMACFFLIILGYLLTPDHAFGEGSVSKMTTQIVTLCSFIGLFLYYVGSLFYHKPLIIRDVEFRMPSFKMAIAQTFLGAVDIVMASLVLYFCLIPFVDIEFHVFMGVFIIAQVLGVFSQVPGGLGVFEGLFMYIIPGECDTLTVFGALLVYRIIYYLLPLLLSGIVLAAYELGLQYKGKRKIAKLKRHMALVEAEDNTKKAS